MTLDEIKEVDMRLGSEVTVACDDGSSIVGFYDEYMSSYDSHDGRDYISVTPNGSSSIYICIDDIKEIVVAA